MNDRMIKLFGLKKVASIVDMEIERRERLEKIQKITQKMTDLYWKTKSEIEILFKDSSQNSDTIKKKIDSLFEERNFILTISDEEKTDYLSAKRNMDWLKYFSDILKKQVDTYYEVKKSPPTTDTKRKSETSSSRRLSESSGSSQASTQKIELTLPEGQSVSDNWGTYTATGKLSFSWKDKSGKTGTYSSSNSGWNQSAEKINGYWAAKSGAQSAAPAGTAAAPEAVAKPGQSGVATVVSDQMVLNVAKVLTDVYGGATYAGRTIFRNEKGMVRKMIDFFNEKAAAIGSTFSSAEALAQIITPSIRPGLGRFTKVSLDGLTEREMEKQYRQELNLIMTAIKNLYDRVKSRMNDLLAFQSGLRAEIESKQPKKQEPTTPPAAGKPTAPAEPAEGKTNPPADDGLTIGKKSSFDPRIKKLAKLRRLRVRSQMEAAVEPSARFGRSRVS